MAVMAVTFAVGKRIHMVAVVVVFAVMNGMIKRRGQVVGLEFSCFDNILDKMHARLMEENERARNA